MILSCYLLFCLPVHSFILCVFVILGFCDISFYFWLLLLTNHFLSKYHHQHHYKYRQVTYVMSYYLIFSLSGMQLLCPDFILISPFLLFCLHCVNLFSVASLVHHQSHSYHHQSPCSIGLVSCLLGCHVGLCSFVCMSYMGWISCLASFCLYFKYVS